MTPLNAHSRRWWCNLCLAWIIATGCVAICSGQESSPEAINVYSDAASFQNSGQFDLAAEEWQKFLKKFPNDPLATKAEHYAGICLLQQRKFEEAAAHFRAVLKNTKFEQVEDAYVNLGWCLYSSASSDNPKNYERAAETFAALLKKFPNGKYADRARFYLGESYYALAKKNEAIDAYKSLVQGHNDSGLKCDALYAWGVTHEELGEFAKAGAVYDIFIQECRDSSLIDEVRMRKAETVLQTGNPAAAEKMFANVAASPGFAEADRATYRQAVCNAKLEKFAAAADLYASIVQKYPESSFVRTAALDAGRCYYRANQMDQAKSWLQKIVTRKDSSAAEAAHWLCRILLEDGEPDRAVAIAQQALKTDPSSDFAVNLKMDEADALYEQVASREAARAKYLSIAEDHPDHELAPQALYNAAFAALESKDHEQAIGHVARFRDKYRDHAFLPDAEYVAADCYLQLGRPADAEAAYRRLIETHAEHPDVSKWRLRHGLSMYLLKRYSNVVSMLTPVLPKFDTPELRAEANYLIGASCFHTQEFDQAAEALRASRSATTDWPQADEVLIVLSRTLQKQNQTRAAVESIKQMIRKYPGSQRLDEAYYRLGEFLYADGNFADANKAYSYAVSHYPDSSFVPFAEFGKGWSAVKNEQYEAGVTSFTAVLTKFPDHELATDARFARGMCLRQTGHYEDAIKDLDQYLKSDLTANEESDALYERGLCEIALKQLDAAAQTFSTLLRENDSYSNEAGVLYELAWTYKDLNRQPAAVAAFKKIAAEHADTPYAAEASFHVGEEQYAKREFDNAAKSYETAKQLAKKPTVLEQATHKLGWAHFRMNDFDGALRQFSDQVASFRDGSLYADGLFMKAESLFRSEEHKDALEAFVAARAQMPKSPRMQVLLLLHGGQSAGQNEDWQTSLKFLQDIPDQFPDSPYLAEALLERGWARQKLKEIDEARKDYERAATLSRNAVGARARFLMGETYFQQKQYAEAINQFRRLMFGFGGESAPEKVKAWQALAGFEAGRCAETQIVGANEPDRAKWAKDAKTYYRFVIEKHGEHEYASKARQRLAALERR